jgi:TetR/AcrR family transcriptional regulator of autoinduction and epiphytic fitness
MASTTNNTVALKLTDRKRLDIINAAIEEFKNQGYGATSMDAIASRAGVSKRTVYNHFPSKDDLFTGVVYKLWEEALQNHQYQYSSTDPLKDQLFKIAEQALELCAAHRHYALARVILAECVRSPELGKKALADFVDSKSFLAGWVQQAVDDGRLKVDDVMMAARQFDGMLDAFAFWPQVVASKPPLEGEKRRKVLSSIIDMFLDHYEVREGGAG